MKIPVRPYTQGIIYAMVAYLSWGILPLYWKHLDAIPAVDVLAHRVLWSAMFTLILCMPKRRGYLRIYYSNPKSFLKLMVTGILVSINSYHQLWTFSLDCHYFGIDIRHLRTFKKEDELRLNERFNRRNDPRGSHCLGLSYLWSFR